MAEGERFDVFLSHYSMDKPKVEWIAGELRKDGLLPFLDKWHITAGDEFQDELVEAMQQSDTAAVFIGPHGMGPWHHEELRVLLDRAARDNADFRLIPVILPDADLAKLDPFLGQRSWVDFRVGDEADAIKYLAAGIRGEALQVDGFELPDVPAPYRGLRRFEADDRKMFFGRNQEVAQLISKLDASSFVAVVGASGSGKSSLVRAGLLPRLSKVQSPTGGDWHQLVCTPGIDPVRNLAQQVAQLAPDPASLTVVDELTERIGSQQDGLATAIEHYIASDPHPVLVFVDQFEELFTMASGEPTEARGATAHFVANLANAAASDHIKVVVTTRADFVASALLVPGVDRLLQDHQIMLGPLVGEGLRQAVVGPADHVGAMFEKGLVSRIIAEVQAEPGALPLLQHALHELWLARKGPWLTIDAYEESGGVVGALAKRAQATYDELTPPRQDIARKIFVRLVTLGEGVPDTRRLVERKELYTESTDPAEVDAVIDALASDRARLIVVGGDTVEVAHEAIVRQWGTYRQWLNRDRDALREHERIRRRTDEWMEDGGELLRGGDVSRAQEFAAQRGDDLNKQERLLIEMSVLEADSELEEAHQRATKLRRRLMLAGAALIAAVIATVVAGYFLGQARTERDNAEQLAKDTSARALARSSESLLEADGQLALMLALKASEVSAVPEAQLALTNALRWPWRRTFATEHNPVSAVDWSPLGTSVLIGGSDSAQLWHIADDRAIDLPGHEGAVRGATFSYDGTLAATGDWGGVARVWRLDGQRVHRLEHQGRWIESVAFSPDARQLLTEGFGWAQIWDIDNNPEVTWQADDVDWAGWAGDGSQLVTVSAPIYGEDEFTRSRSVITVRDGQSGNEVSWSIEALSPVAVNPAGTLIAANNIQGEAIIYDLEGNWVNSLRHRFDTFVEFDPDGERVATRSDGNGYTIVMHLSEGSEIALRNGSSSYFSEGDATFSPDGGSILTTPLNGLNMWDLTGPARIDGHGHKPEECLAIPASLADGSFSISADWSSVNSATYSPDGDLIATGGDDCTVRIWGQDRQAIGKPLPHPGRVLSVTFSPSGRHVLSQSVDCVARIWQLDAQSPVEFGGEDDCIESAGFSEAGDQIIGVDADQRIAVWGLDGSFVRYLDLGQEQALFTPDSIHVITTDEVGATRVRLAENGDLVAELKDYTALVLHAAISPDGSTIVTSTVDGESLVWDSSGEIRGQLREAVGARFAFSPDGQRIASTGGDFTEVWEWDLDGNVMAVHGVGLPVTSTAYNHDGSQIVVGAVEGAIFFISSPDVAAAQQDARERLAGRQFTADECARYDIPNCSPEQ